MALLTLFFDVSSKQLVRSLINGGRYDLPPFHTEDTLDIDLTIVRRLNYTTPPYFSIISNANYALEIAIGTACTVRAGGPGLVWTKNSDNSIFSGQIPLNTSGINGLADNASQIFEIRLFDGTGYNRCQAPCRIIKSVALAAALAVIPSDTALGKIEASEIYMPYELPPGRGYILTSADSTKKILHYLDNDGTERAVNVPVP